MDTRFGSPNIHYVTPVQRAAANRTTGVSKFGENVRLSVQQECPRFRPRWYPMMALLELTRFAAWAELSASRYSLIVARLIPNSLAIPRMDSPLRFAFCIAFHRSLWRNVGFQRWLPWRSRYRLRV